VPALAAGDATIGGVTETAARAARRLEARVAALSIAPSQVPFVLRTVVGLAVIGVGANVVGAVVVALLILAVNANATDHQLFVLLVGTICSVAASVVVGSCAAIVLQHRTLRWVLRGRVPNATDARRAVRLPLDMGVIAAVIWLLDDVVISVLAAVSGADASLVTGIASGIVVAGLCSSGVTYLLVARVGQPVSRVALSAHPPGRAPMVSVRARLMLVWVLTTGVPVLGILLILFAPHGRTHIRGASIVTVFIAIFVGAVSTALAARSIGTPLRNLVGVLERVGDGDLDIEVTIEDPGEIGLLQAGVNDMLAGLRERERIHDLFGRHVGPAVAEEALRSGVTLSGEARDVVALFVDITGSTALTRTTEPAEFVAMLNRFFQIVVDAVERNGGLVNKFEGDAALCVFGAPVELADAADCALRAAREIRDEVRAADEVQVGVGIAAGPAVAGQIGSASRLEYTVIGDAVNEAARLTDLAKGVPGGVLASSTVLDRCSATERGHWRDAGEVVLRGRAEPTAIWTA
jgi:adenylate cyclase